MLQNLAKEMGLHIVEWINAINANNIIQRPVMQSLEKESWRPASLDEGTNNSLLLLSEGASFEHMDCTAEQATNSRFFGHFNVEYAPVMRSFQEFFSRAHRFSPLQLSSSKPQQTHTQNAFGGLNSSSPATSTSSSSTGWMQSPRSGPVKKNIILIEDLPPVSALSSRKIFQDTIHNFANSRASTSSVLVIIVSDVFSKQSTELQFSSTRESSDPALTMRTLLPSSILGKLDSGAKNDNARIRQIK